MEFAAVTKTRKTELIVGFSLAIFLLNGCVARQRQAGQTQTCREAEEAVKKAQIQYTTASRGFAVKPQDKTVSGDFATKIQKLQEEEENAFVICNSVDN